eukprot:TRINITY_DN12304_c0_g1_i2.p1 TRINITY_DN12304_c0_g1~~TRINITY_DN12304_c0_g1_i2.p1  ORF type:complete len:407 (-),score=78.32 TRINITY_DN12304_c0_g1_i2:410-1630(-)
MNAVDAEAAGHVSGSELPPDHAGLQGIQEEPTAKETADGPSSGCAQRCRRQAASLGAFVNRNFLVLGLMLSLPVGLGWPAIGSELSRPSIDIMGTHFPFFSTLLVMIMFVINGLLLETAEMKSALKDWKACCFGLASILLLTPWFGLIPLQLGYLPRTLALGFVIFHAMPTTLSTGITLTLQAEGNAALALVLTVTSNLLGIFISPFLLKIMMSVGGIKLSPWELLLKLGISVVLPLAVAKLARDMSAMVRHFVSSCRSHLLLLQQACVFIIAWLKLSDSADVIIGTDKWQLIFTFLTCLVLHGALILFNIAATRLLRFGAAESTALVLVCAEKTFPVAVTVISFLNPAQVGNVGLLVIPCLLGHFVQLFWDSFMVLWWMRGGESSKQGKSTSDDSDDTQVDESAV